MNKIRYYLQLLRIASYINKSMPAGDGKWHTVKFKIMLTGDRK